MDLSSVFEGPVGKTHGHLVTSKLTTANCPLPFHWSYNPLDITQSRPQRWNDGLQQIPTHILKNLWKEAPLNTVGREMASNISELSIKIEDLWGKKVLVIT